MLRLSDRQLAELEEIYRVRRLKKLTTRYSETLSAWLARDAAQTAAWFGYIAEATRHLPGLRDDELIALAELARIENTGSVDCPAFRRCCETPGWPMRALWLKGELSLATPDSPFVSSKA